MSEACVSRTTVPNGFVDTLRFDKPVTFNLDKSLIDAFGYPPSGSSIPFTSPRISIKIPDLPAPPPKPKTYVFLDLETTGVHPGEHGICQIGAWATGENEDHFKGYFLEDCNPNMGCRDYVTFVTYDDGALAVNGFTQKRIAKSAPLYAVLERFSAFLERFSDTDIIFVCQNTPFDIAFMKAAYRAARMNDKVFRRTLDTISFGFMVYGECLSLAQLCEKLGIKNGNAHDALADSFTTSKVFHRLYKQVKQAA